MTISCILQAKNSFLRRDYINSANRKIGYTKEDLSAIDTVPYSPVRFSLTISFTIFQAKYSFLREAGYGGKFDTIHRADLRVSDISNLLGGDWVRLGRELGVEEQDINLIITEYPDNVGQQAMVMLRSEKRERETVRQDEVKFVLVQSSVADCPSL